MRRFTLAIALVLALVLPGSALAAMDTTESLTKGATISFVAPATATFVSADTLVSPQTASPATKFGYQAELTFDTDNPTGLNVKVAVDPWARVGGGATNIPTTAREGWINSCAPATCTNPGEGVWLTSSTQVTIISSTAAVTGGSTTIEYDVAKGAFTVPGSYTSAAHYIAAVN